MPYTQDLETQRAVYWSMPILRAIPAAALAVVITFSADHSAHFGLLAFGIYGVVAGILLGILGYFRLPTTTVRSFFIAQAAVTMLCGLLALAAIGGGVRYLFLILTFFTAITGLLELYSGFRTRGRFVASGDWRTTGILTLIVAIVFLLVPPEYSHTFTGPDGITRMLDSAVVVVGVLGAYAAILAVYLLIAGFSAKWGTQSTDGSSTTTDRASTETSSKNSASESETSL